MADLTSEGSAQHTVTRREAWKLSGATVGVLAASRFLPRTAAASSPVHVRADTAPPWNHDPASPLGPSHWATIGYPVCGSGAAQSPVNIATSAVRPVPGPPLAINYATSALTIKNTGHYFEVPIPAGPANTLHIGNDSYQLVQYHFHTPSEHEVNGRLADVEAHFVHQDSQGAIAVVGVFFRTGASPNALLDKIFFSVPVTAYESVTVGEASPADLFPGRSSGKSTTNVGSFYTYDGSLTTPGCTEGVRWFLLADGGRVSAAALRRSHYVISQFPYYHGYRNNNRPVLPLNGRVIGFRCAGR